jgi:hypothetical protein
MPPAPDPKKLVPPFPEFAGEFASKDVARFLALLADQAMSAASLDPPGVTFEQGAKAPGHRAAVGLVIAAGNYAWMRYPEEARNEIVDFTAELLKRLGVPPVHGWRQN